MEDSANKPSRYVCYQNMSRLKFFLFISLLKLMAPHHALAGFGHQLCGCSDPNLRHQSPQASPSRPPHGRTGIDGSESGPEYWASTPHVPSPPTDSWPLKHSRARHSDSSRSSAIDTDSTDTSSSPMFSRTSMHPSHPPQDVASSSSRRPNEQHSAFNRNLRRHLRKLRRARSQLISVTLDEMRRRIDVIIELMSSDPQCFQHTPLFDLMMLTYDVLAWEYREITGDNDPAAHIQAFLNLEDMLKMMRDMVATRAQYISNVCEYHETENPRNCIICTTDFEVGEKIRTLSCDHQYHRNCIDNWLFEHTTCPLCRSTVTESWAGSLVPTSSP
ncbi:hypothetical protein SeMB42_g06856 [Synchytrium endobioticum]|uniref:RING-type domain-containing protein n=1 Tax=Synchytrium endobioticum TaxID=286115 RepID=A0A507CDY0_9FUNG|nr:hypothetical protein SeMB42_g06856 [Synchytrium endobioticum]